MTYKVLIITLLKCVLKKKKKLDNISSKWEKANYYPRVENA